MLVMFAPGFSFLSTGYEFSALSRLVYSTAPNSGNQSVLRDSVNAPLTSKEPS